MVWEVKSIAECSKVSLTFIKLPFATKTCVLSFFERLFYTGFTVWFGRRYCLENFKISERNDDFSYSECLTYSKTYVKQTLKNRQNKDLNDKW